MHAKWNKKQLTQVGHIFYGNHGQKLSHSDKTSLTDEMSQLL